MAERLPATDRARKVIALSIQEAQRLGHDHVGTEHLLLGLVKEASGTAAVVLQEFKLDLSLVRQTVLGMGHGPSKGPPPLKLDYTERLDRVLDYASEEARSLSHNYVGTEHLLLGLLREPEGTAARALANLNLELGDVRDGVLNLLGKAPEAKDALVEKAIKDMAIHLADEQIDGAAVRKIAAALIHAGWRPRQ